MQATVVRRLLGEGLFIPAHPLAITDQRKLDERRQRALTRYYLEAGSGGLAVGVHSTQFEIHKPTVGLYQPVLRLAIETAHTYPQRTVMIAGVVGETPQALAEATLAKDLGYDAILLSLGGLAHFDLTALLEHCRAVAEVMPVVGFYLQPLAGGISLPYRFWRCFAEIESVVAIKIAPFNRYATLDVLRGVVDSGRASEIALYTGNDNSILLDLLTPFYLISAKDGQPVTLRIVGGLLGHWAAWTHTATRIFSKVREVVKSGQPVPQSMLQLAAQITDCNAAFFDAANGFRGSIPGIQEVLRRQGLLAGGWCLDPDCVLSPGQAEEIDRVTQVYPHLNDDAFVAAHLDQWLDG